MHGIVMYGMEKVHGQINWFLNIVGKIACTD